MVPNRAKHQKCIYGIVYYGIVFENNSATDVSYAPKGVSLKNVHISLNLVQSKSTTKHDFFYIANPEKNIFWKVLVSNAFGFHRKLQILSLIQQASNDFPKNTLRESK